MGKEEAKILDGFEVDGYKLSYAYSRATEGKFEYDSFISVETPDGNKINLPDYHDDIEFRRMAENLSSKEFEDNVYSGKINKEEVMGCLDGAEKASKNFESCKTELKEAKETASQAADNLKAATKEEATLGTLEKELDSVHKTFMKYKEANPKKAEQMYAYINDIIQSAAKGTKPKTPNPLEPQGFFGKMKAKFLGHKRTKEESNLDWDLQNLKNIIEINPQFIKDSLKQGKTTLAAVKGDIGEKKTVAENKVKTCDAHKKESDRKVEEVEMTVARNAYCVAKFNKLAAGIEKVFGNKEAAKEIELRATARDTTGIKDAQANTGVDRLADKAKAMEGMTPQERLAFRMSLLRGTSKEEPAPVRKTEMSNQMVGKIAGLGAEM